ncbi:MAG TPA: hypothetical protein VFA77_09765 [Candidatus Eisenbacteria bacterium]|nr:hypothetical protein [Candidatus Eisenbacteria bacterium]
MKPSTLIVALILLSLGLITAAAYLIKTSPTPVAAATAPSTTVITNTRTKIVREPDAPTAPAPGLNFTWSSVEAANYKEYIANLRAIDCPEETIRDLILADVNKLYAPREAPFKTKAEAPLPWEPAANVAAARLDEVEKRRQLREVQKEKSAVLKELLGIDLPLDLVRTASSRNYDRYEMAINALPESKREMVREIQENYWQTSDALGDKYNHNRTAAYLEEYKRLNLERKAALARALTPEEMEEYDMRTSNTGNSLINQLADFKPTEKEFREIFRIRKQVEEPFEGAMSVNSVDAGDNQSSADRKRQANEQIKQALGPERAAEFDLSQDFNYRRLATVGERYGVPQENILKAYELQKASQADIQKIGNDRNLSNQQRTEAYQNIQAGNARALTEILGERAAKALNRRGGNNYVEVLP